MVEFNRLNPVGKAVFIAGSAFKTLGALLDFTVGAVGSVWTEAEKAFRDELNDDVEDANVIREDRN